MKTKLTAVSFIALLLSGCSLAPGGHIPDSSSGGLFSDDTRNAYEQEFSEAELSKLVDTYQISPMLLAEMQTKPSKPAFNSALEQARSNYDYTVGRGDILNITVWNHPELTIPAGSMRSAEEAGNWVHNDGTIFYPYIGEVEVAGMKVTEIRDMITRRLAKYIESPQVDVTVAAFRSQRVYVTGAVNEPGTVPVTNVPMTLIEAVNAAGGLSEAANWNRVTLTRGDRKLDFNLRELYQSGNTDQNILLQTNDVVHVARNDDNKVFVLGEVRKPQSYIMGQSGTTLAEALADAGGWQEISADAAGIFVIRQPEPDSGKIAKVYQLNAANTVALVMAEQFELQQRDIVYVTAAPISRWNRVINQLLPSVTGLYSLGRFSDDVSN
ncbi:polysaccharide biosynthesis/export family protein [Pseudidiomarina sp. 1APP75-32.1]|uniref:Polysaccharide biosynthesis/export family protein n=1 Tax=Pseudidiomarina terrestris TaxID=2820060 RepID=A0AAW7R062_9GAMM|nr:MULTISPECIES: polysaccharide export protein [unclassified Pseudidiomarina]MDN7124503.1 polysaccharide biosynthesis/export family protein [Pseudidiomarina sp. 1APP75-32.1]MDN7129206.1 polysaccharide biosynthesis/export family protein [Pseudidiomarina sp. 1APR75-15]